MRPARAKYATALVVGRPRPPANSSAIHTHVLQVDLGASGVRFKLSPHAGGKEVVRQTTLQFLMQEHAQAAINAPDQVDLRTYGKTFQTKWVTIHDTAVDGSAPFSANALAKAADGTPFKRPENGQFRPGSHFTQFFFDETGDTNATSPENGTAGGWTSIFELDQESPSADSGQLSLFYQSNSATVAGLDNVTFLSRDLVTFVEDAGDTLHTQRKALDSGYIWDVTKDYSTGLQPVRWLAEGRDPSATLDSATGGFGKNEGDNEITGAHVSNGDPGPEGLLGAQIPNLWNSSDKWRWFYTQQHGDNFTWQVVLASQAHRESDQGENEG